jgi:hypothetical protein
MMQLLTAKELAREVPVGEHKIRTLARTFKDFPCIRNGTFTYFIKEDVEDWLKDQAKNGIKL